MVDGVMKCHMTLVNHTQKNIRKEDQLCHNNEDYSDLELEKDYYQYDAGNSNISMRGRIKSELAY